MIANHPKFARSFALSTVVLLTIAATGRASTFTYSAAGNTSPASPFGMLDVNTPIPTPTGTSVAVSGASLNVGPTSTTGYDFLGFNGPAAGITLDHTQTVQVSATLELLSESTLAGHTADRAGLGIALTDDRNEYAEMYINGSTISLNQTGRVLGVSAPAPSDVESAFHTYMLQLNGDTVTVFLDGSQILQEPTGGIYTPPAGDLPTLANTAAVGDITSDSNSTYKLTSFTVAVVPEPATLGLIGSGLLLASLRRRRIACMGRISSDSRDETFSI